MRRHMVAVLTVIAAVTIVGGVAATGTGEQGVDPLVVGMELQYPPFEMSDAAGNPTGISVDLAYAIGEKLGRPVEIRNTAWTGLIPALRSKNIDMILSSMTITEEREEQVDFSQPYVQSGLTLLINAESAVQSAADLNAESVVLALKSGTTGAIYARDNLPNAEVRLFEEVAACVLEVSQGKADAFIYDALTVYENWSNHQETTRYNLEALPGTFSPWGIAFHDDDDALREQVNGVLTELRTEGLFDELAERYLSDIAQTFAAEGIPFFFDL